MPLELLHKLARSPLPQQVSDPSDIDKLRALHAAGQVRAQIPAPQRGLGGQEVQEPAVVFEITRLGLMAVRTFRPPSGDAPEEPGALSIAAEAAAARPAMAAFSLSLR